MGKRARDEVHRIYGSGAGVGPLVRREDQLYAMRVKAMRSGKQAQIVRPEAMMTPFLEALLPRVKTLLPKEDAPETPPPA